MSQTTSMNRFRGGPISGSDRKRQSIRDVITTPLGSRVMRRDYGSVVTGLIDRPLNDATRQLIRAGVAGPVNRWVKGVRITRVDVSGDASGASEIDIIYSDTDLPAAGAQALTIQF